MMKPWLYLFFILIYGSCAMMGDVTTKEKGLPEAPKIKWTDDPGELGMDPALIEEAYQALDRGAKEKKVPGSVAVIGFNGIAIHARAFGHSVLEPEKIEMTPGTVFDLASLTKMVATNTSVMILLNRGKIALDDPVIKYLPEFGAKGKDKITIRQLATHTSGFPAFKRYYMDKKGKEEFYKAICEEGLATEPGTKRTYSDIGFMTLGFIVEKVSGKDLNEFTQENIFQPLGMKHTRFNPPASWKKRCAATEVWPVWKRLAWGEVHDENANANGGIAGHAGLFSTAEDLAIFCQMLVNGGTYGDIKILTPETVRQFSILQLDPKISDSQAMGWILETESRDNAENLGAGSFGHTGFTGTSLWIHPGFKAFAILLTNAIHPDREKADRGFVRKPFHQALKKALENYENSKNKK